MTRTPIIFSLLLILVAPALSSQDSAKKLEWDLEIPPVPDMHGFAGAFTGVSNGRLLVAGGANFPDKPPWENGKKVWHDKIFALSLPGGGGGDSGWVSAGTRPGPLA